MADTLVTNDTTITCYYPSPRNSEVLIVMDTSNNFHWYRSFPPSSYTYDGIEKVVSSKIGLYRSYFISHGSRDSLNVDCFYMMAPGLFNWKSTELFNDFQGLKDACVDTDGNLHVVGEM